MWISTILFKPAMLNGMHSKVLYVCLESLSNFVKKLEELKKVDNIVRNISICSDLMFVGCDDVQYQ